MGEGLVNMSEFGLGKGLGNVVDRVLGNKLDFKLALNNQHFFSPTSALNSLTSPSSISTTSDTQTSMDVTDKKDDDTPVPVQILLR